ncbi:MAG: SDR family oxidoreductase [Rhodobacteraceae bacterium]|nr:SDR family oxidoreductase [Paracoccaceae bacterium]
MAKHKTIIITGGSRGIGRAVALLAGQRGWSVAVNYQRDERSAAEVVQQIITAGGRAEAIKGDVQDPADMAGLFERAEAAFGRVDGLVANAGVTAPLSKLADMDIERIERLIGVNLMGAIICAREAARRFGRPKAEAAGAIVFLSSAAARLGSANEFVDYAATKGAIDTLTKGLSIELAAENIRVNAVRPGLIATEMHASGGVPDRAERLGRNVPMGRPGRADEVAQAIIWLLSDEASYVTGAVLDVTGGR